MQAFGTAKDRKDACLIAHSATIIHSATSCRASYRSLAEISGLDNYQQGGLAATLLGLADCIRKIRQ